MGFWHGDFHKPGSCAVFRNLVLKKAAMNGPIKNGFAAAPVMARAALLVQTRTEIAWRPPIAARCGKEIAGNVRGQTSWEDLAPKDRCQTASVAGQFQNAAPSE